MSSLVIEVCKVDAVEKHPSADRMEIAQVRGWKTCVGVGQFAKGDKAVYFPPDSVLPVALAERLGVAKYLSPVPADANGVSPGLRVRVSRLRGQPSYGLIMKPDDPAWEVGKDVAAILGVTKWEAPLDCTDGDAERPHPAFHGYFNLEHWQNYPDVIQDGEEAVLTEKIHGKNCRVGLIRDTKDDGSMIWRFMAGSHDVRRKEMQTQRKRRTVRNQDGTLALVQGKEEEFFFEVTKRSSFWEVMDVPGVKELLLSLCNGRSNVVVFGEMYGSGVQNIAYGLENGRWEFRVFDITVDGKYLDYDAMMAACTDHRVQTVPVLYRGPFSKDVLDKHVSGPTTVCPPEKAGPFKGREGVVIKAAKERTVAAEGKFFDRAALKAVSFEYLEYQGKNKGTEYH